MIIKNKNWKNVDVLKQFEEMWKNGCKEASDVATRLESDAIIPGAPSTDPITTASPTTTIEEKIALQLLLSNQRIPNQDHKTTQMLFVNPYKNTINLLKNTIVIIYLFQALTWGALGNQLKRIASPLIYLD